MEQSEVTSPRVLVLAAVAALALGVAAYRLVPKRAPDAPRPVHVASVQVPANTRIKVEVLNATRTHGLARRATMQLRDHGFDVVETGTSAAPRDSTLVLDRSGHPEWARLAAKAMGGATVESRPDTSRYVDLTVFVGASWRPPAEPFYP